MKHSKIKKNIDVCKYVCALACGILSATTTFAQERFNKTKDVIKSNVERNIQERVYLHTDNTSYKGGEKIWFKANVLRGDNYSATDISRYLYVELLNPMGFHVRTKKYLLENGQCDGCIELQDSLRSGFYELRAYTTWMLNFTHSEGHAWKKLRQSKYKDFHGGRFQDFLKGNVGIYSRVLPIIGQVPFAGKSSCIDRKGEELIVDFYAEGGNLLEGVEGRIAFDAHTEGGLGTEVDGVVKHGGKVILTTKSLHEGRGSFVIPAEYMRSNCDLYFIAGKNRYKLPKVQAKGVNMVVNRKEGNHEFIIRKTEKTEIKDAILCVTCRQKLLSCLPISFKDKENDACSIISDTLLTTGVNIATLISAKGKVLSQRKFFVQNGDRNVIKVKAESSLIQPCSDVQLRLSCGKEYKNSPLSIAVRDANQTEKIEEYPQNIFTEMLLSSEIKGYVSNPSWYFETKDEERARALDDLLLVQGWTRYDFENLTDISNTEKTVFEPERNLEFKAEMFNTDGSEYRNQWTTCRKPFWVYGELFSDKTGIGYDIKAEGKSGTFTLPIPKDMGRCELWFMLNDKSIDKIGEAKASFWGHIHNPNEYFIKGGFLSKGAMAQTPYSPLPRNYSIYETQYKFSQKPIVADGLPLVAEINPDDMMYNLSNAYGRVMYLDQSEKIPEDVLLLEIMGMEGSKAFTHGANRTELFSEAKINKGIDPLKMRIMPNGLNCEKIQIYADMDNRSTIYATPKFMERVNHEYIKSIADSKNHHDKNNGNTYPMRSHIHYVFPENARPKDETMTYYGFKTIVYSTEPPVEFYCPDYSKVQLKDGETDHRRTLYWNPNVVTDDKGNAEVSFYNNSTCTELNVSAEGVTTDGSLFAY